MFIFTDSTISIAWKDHRNVIDEGNLVQAKLLGGSALVDYLVAGFLVKVKKALDSESFLLMFIFTSLSIFIEWDDLLKYLSKWKCVILYFFTGIKFF